MFLVTVFFLFIPSAHSAHFHGDAHGYPMTISKLFRHYADILRTKPLLDDPALNSVTREFGVTLIRMRDLPIRSGLGIADPKPWSSWWFPKKETYLFEDHDGPATSPLTKYDLYRQLKYATKRRGSRTTPSSAAEFERRQYSSKTQTWEGLCDAWSIASIAKPEPKHPVTFFFESRPITFEIVDLKALLLKTFEAVDDSGLKYYGEKFIGDFNGWIFPDLFPEQFHRFIEMVIFRHKETFIMDHDPGVEVWTVPVYKANYLIQTVADNPNAVFVQTWLYSAESSTEDSKGFVGTRELVRQYNYILQGERDANGDLVIQSGYWIKGSDGLDSRKDHPDYFIRVPDSAHLDRKSWNPEIDIDVIDEILSQSY